MAFEFFFEERIWYIASTIDTFSLNTIPAKVEIELRKRIWKNKINLQNLNLNKPSIYDESKDSYLMYDFT